MKRADDETLFVRFINGTPSRIQADIIETINLFIQESAGSIEPLKVLKKHISQTGRGLNIDSSWFRLIEECYLIFETDLSKNKFNYCLLTDILNILLTKKTIEEKWQDIKELILANIDLFSMWEYSYNKIIAEERNIKRQDDGTYVEYDENEICEIIGRKTFDEEKFDYIMSSTLNEYGSIYCLLKFIAVVFISIDYLENKNKYPNSVSIFLFESESSCSFLRWKWKMERLYGYSKSGWRPNNNCCDPDWLVSDLLANYSDEIISTRETIIFDLPNDEIMQQFENAFENYPYQYACAIDTDLIFGTEDEVYFDFKGRKIRWINGKTYLRAIIVVPSIILDIEEDETILNEFISSLVWETGIPIRKIFQAGAAKRFLPIVSSAKNIGGINLRTPKLKFNGNNAKKKEIIALALYKEGINSKSVYYSFLSYYKIIELLFSGRKQDIIALINQSRDLLISSGYSNRIDEIDSFGKDFGDYIYVSCRCAVAHAGQIESTVNPDDIDDYRRITKDLPLIKEIAKDIIKSGRISVESWV